MTVDVEALRRAYDSGRPAARKACHGDPESYCDACEGDSLDKAHDAGLRAVAEAALKAVASQSAEPFAKYHDERARYGGVGWEFHARCATYLRYAGSERDEAKLQLQYEREQSAQARKERDAALRREGKALREASEATAEVKRLTGRGLGALHEAFELAEERIGAGCGDSLCRFEKARGMMTNGGCRCVDRPFVVSALAALYKEAKRALKGGGP